jgi:hypothetical protein
MDREDGRKKDRKTSLAFYRLYRRTDYEDKKKKHAGLSAFTHSGCIWEYFDF